MKKIKYLIVFCFLLLFFFGCISPQEKYGSIMIPYMTGDCVDRAVQIRQDLRANGYEADIVLGGIKRGDKVEGHAWIRYKDKETGEWKRIDNY